MRLVLEILHGVRDACGPQFLLGLRLSPERFGMKLSECIRMSQIFIDSALLDFLDLSLWDCFKRPEEAHMGPKSLLEQLQVLRRKRVRLTVAGKISSARDVQTVLNAGIDFVTIGRSAILHHDFPNRVNSDPGFKPIALPVSADYLRGEGLGEAFIHYMRRWKNFVST
jgi:2,4-dienoyl-CoA reductase-like NADH-dependent reductase (Old Yellow Enzyme family)